MKTTDLLEELQVKPEYKIFKKQNPDTFFTVAFLILDLENETEQIQLDFFLPSQNEIAAFSHPFTEPKIHDSIISVSKKLAPTNSKDKSVRVSGATEPAKPKPMQPQTLEIKIDIDNLESKCKELIKENKSSIVPTKIIAILKDDIWNLTCMDNALGIVRIKINAISGEPQDFQKGNLMSFMGIKKK